VDATGGVATKFGNLTRRTITPNLIQLALDQQRVRAGHGRAVDQLISDLQVRRMFWQGLSPDRRFETAIYDGGWEELAFSNGEKKIPWFADELCPRYTIFGLHTGTSPRPTGHKVDKIADEEVLAIYESPYGAAEWDEATGSDLKQVYSGANFVDAVGAFIKWYMNLATVRPNVHMRMDDIAES